jgi:hypothetical protein
MWDVDFMHPIDPGMAAIADMAVHLLQSTAMGLLMHPLGRQDKELLQERLPPPMHAGRRCAATGCVVTGRGRMGLHGYRFACTSAALVGLRQEGHAKQRKWAIRPNIASNIKQSTAMGLLMHPLGRQDKELLQERLPPPMHAGRRCVATGCVATGCGRVGWHGHSQHQCCSGFVRHGRGGHSKQAALQELGNRA